jgi:hypothetical protein
MAEKEQTAAGPAEAPAPAPKPTQAERELSGKAEGIGYLKDWTLALIEIARKMDGWIAGLEDHGDIQESIDETLKAIDENLVGLNVTLSRWNYVADRLLDINKGDKEAKPPVEPRKPTFDDVVDALGEFDAQVEAEAAEEEKLAKDAEDKEKEAAKPPMLTNKSVAGPKLPPLPEAPSRPPAS